MPASLIACLCRCSRQTVRARVHLWPGRRPNRASDRSIAESALRVTRATNVLIDRLILIAINHKTTFVVSLLDQVIRVNYRNQEHINKQQPKENRGDQIMDIS